MSKKYYIKTLNPQRIINNKEKRLNKYKHWEYGFKLDFRERHMDEYSSLISTERYNENALFRQMEFVINGSDEEKDEKDHDEECLMDTLFYLDFTYLFKYKKELKEEFSFSGFEKEKNGLSEKKLGALDLNELLYFFFMNGFDIIKDNDEDGNSVIKHYVPFDSSASMSRNSVVSFIDEEILGKVNERLMLGIDITKKEEQVDVKPHKYFAYRGLYMTDGMRIENNDSFILNEETVIVIDDAVHDIRSSFTRTAKENKVSGKWEFSVKKDLNIKINAFDGEGLINPDYAKEINRQLFGRERENAANSFQVRMPFIKGMLHCVDYEKFYQDECGIDIVNGFYVKDIYGFRRDLSKAKIILTKSMLKNQDWLKEAVKNKKGQYDPMKYYFEKMDEYAYRLYIVRTDISLDNRSKEIKLNYQSLSTLSMTGDEFDKKIGEYIEKIKEIETNPDKQREFVLGERKNNVRAWEYALSRNISMLNDAYIKKTIRDMIDSEIRGIYSGNISVSGENRFLSGDLLALLIHLLRQNDVEDVKKSEDIKRTIRELKEKTIKTNEFRAPDPRVKLEGGKIYAFLRNPHLSKNEDCVLTYPRKDDQKDKLYETYFGKLSGIIMVAYSSYAPMTLGGADFDGDMVKLITDVDIIKAMKKSREICHELVQIPSVSEGKKPFPKGIEYSDIKDSFGNQVGHISNMAIRLGERIYCETDNTIAEKDNKGNDGENAKYRYIPADCTILVGLEIDAAKNGKHPKENIKELEEQVKSSEKDYLSLLNKLRELKPENILIRDTQKTVKDKGETYTICCKNPKKNIEIHLKKDNGSNISKLIPLYVETMYSYRQGFKKEKLKGYLECLTDKPKLKHDACTWVGDDNKTYGQSWAIIDVYNLFSRRYRMLRNDEEDYKSQIWYGKALMIIGKQYYGREDFEDKQNHLSGAYSEIESFIKDGSKCSEYGEGIKMRCRAMVERMDENKWIYQPEDHRLETLKAIVPETECNLLYENEDWCGILTNFSGSGCMLLYYLIKAAEGNLMDMKELDESRPIFENRRFKNNCNEKDEQTSESLKSIKGYDQICSEYEKTYNQAFEALESIYQWAVKKKISASLFDSLMRKKIYNELMADKINKYGEMIYNISESFFWKMFDGKDGTERFKEGDYIEDLLPYKKWENSDQMKNYAVCEESAGKEDFPEC